jgi:type IV pilus assembly protein PilO
MAAKPQASQGSPLDRLPLAAKVIVGVVVVALLAGVYFVLFYGEIDSQITAAHSQAVQLDTQLKQAKASQEAYQKDLDEKTSREQRAREQKKLLPDDAETPAFLSGVQNVATISGVTLTSWTPIEDVPQQFFAKVPMKLTLTGRFHQVAKFFHGVGQLDRIINMEDIHIKAGKAEGEDTPVTVECLATAFRAMAMEEPQASDPKKKGAGGK